MSVEDWGAAEITLRSPTGGSVVVTIVGPAEEAELVLADLLERGYELEEPSS